MKRKLFTAVCILLASAIAPYGAFAKAKKDAKKDIGIQLYSVRDLIGSFGRNQHDYKPVLKALADMGYTSIEAASYNDGKFYGNTPEEFRRDVEAVGMKVLSSHCGKGLSDEELASGDFSESMKWWDQCIAAHKAAGMEYIGKSEHRHNPPGRSTNQPVGKIRRPGPNDAAQVGGLLSAGYGKSGICRRICGERKTEQYGQRDAHDPTTGNHEVAGRSGKASKRLGTSDPGLLPSCFLIGTLLRLFVFSPFAGDSGFLGFTHSR